MSEQGLKPICSLSLPWSYHDDSLRTSVFQVNTFDLRRGFWVFLHLFLKSVVDPTYLYCEFTAVFIRGFVGALDIQLWLSKINPAQYLTFFKSQYPILKIRKSS